MSEFNKSYRIRTEVGKDTHLHVKLDQKYDVLEIMSLKIDQENAYRLHTSNYGVIAGRVLANGSFGIPNAKISVFINVDEDDINDPVKAALYPYNTTNSKDKDGVGHFYGHWNESIKIFDKYKDLFGLSEEEVLLINNLIYYHDCREYI